MGKVNIVLLLTFALLVLGGAVFLAFWQPPVPSAPVKKVLSNALFTH